MTKTPIPTPSPPKMEVLKEAPIQAQSPPKKIPNRKKKKKELSMSLSQEKTQKIQEEMRKTHNIRFTKPELKEEEPEKEVGFSAQAKAYAQFFTQVSPVKEESKKKTPDQKGTCSICYESLTSKVGKKVVSYKTCQHRFHFCCLDDICIEESDPCPVCNDVI